MRMARKHSSPYSPLKGVSTEIISIRMEVDRSEYKLYIYLIYFHI